MIAMRTKKTVSEQSRQSLATRAREGLRLYRGQRSIQPGREYASDPGDLGRGIYYTSFKARARGYGEVTQQQVTFSNPLVLSEKEAYTLADQYQTVRIDPPEEMIQQAMKTGVRFDWPAQERVLRLANAERMTRDILAKGHDGLIVVMDGHLEVVDYRPYKK